MYYIYKKRDSKGLNSAQKSGNGFERNYKNIAEKGMLSRIDFHKVSKKNWSFLTSEQKINYSQKQVEKYRSIKSAQAYFIIQ